jgi:hypothetical protein
MRMRAAACKHGRVTVLSRTGRAAAHNTTRLHHRRSSAGNTQVPHGTRPQRSSPRPQNRTGPKSRRRQCGRLRCPRGALHCCRMLAFDSPALLSQLLRTHAASRLQVGVNHTRVRGSATTHQQPSPLARLHALPQGCARVVGAPLDGALIGLEPAGSHTRVTRDTHQWCQRRRHLVFYGASAVTACSAACAAATASRRTCFWGCCRLGTCSYRAPF